MEPGCRKRSTVISDEWLSMQADMQLIRIITNNVTHCVMCPRAIVDTQTGFSHANNELCTHHEGTLLNKAGAFSHS